MQEQYKAQGFIIIAGHCKDPGLKDEAQFLKDQILAEGERLLADAKLDETEDPANALATYQEVSTGFKKSEPANKADARIKELKADKAFQDELKVAKDVQKIKDLCE